MNKDKRNNIQLLGTLNNADESGIIANANQVYDANEDKSTQDVSKEHKERIETLETKESSMQTTLENITKTGEASAASNVTYNHNNSQLDASNVQQAIDEVRKRSNYNDGDNIIDFNTIHLITDNPEYICVAVDADEKILYGIKTDGQPYFGVGCPQQVKDYIDEQINKILGTNDITTTIDSLKEIEAFLKDFTNSDTLKKLLDLKANVDEVRGTTDDIYKKSNPNDSEGNVVDTNTIISIEDNPEYIKALTDSVGKLIEAIGIDGIRKFFAGINIQGTLQCVTDNPEYIAVWLDNQDKIIFAIENDGNPYFGYGVPKQINAAVYSKIDELTQSLENVRTDIDKKIKLGDIVYPSNVYEITDNPEYVSAIIDSAKHLLETYGVDGVKRLFNAVEIMGTRLSVEDNPEYIKVDIDNEGKILGGFDTNGDYSFGMFPTQIQKKAEEIVDKELYKKNAIVYNYTYKGDTIRIDDLKRVNIEFIDSTDTGEDYLYSRQGMTVYENYLFAFRAHNGNEGYCKIFKIDESNGKPKLNLIKDMFRLAWFTPNHINTATLGKKQNETDDFPLFYIDPNISGDRQVDVEKISLDGTTEKIQTIKIGTYTNGANSNSCILWATDGEYLYIYGTTGYDIYGINDFIVAKFNIPSLEEKEVSLDMNDALYCYKTEDYGLHVNNVLQGCCIHNGLMFLPLGYGWDGGKTELIVWDLENRKLKARIALNKPTDSLEPEDVAIYKDTLLMHFGGTGKIYQFKFL